MQLLKQYCVKINRSIVLALVKLKKTLFAICLPFFKITKQDGMIVSPSFMH